MLPWAFEAFWPLVPPMENEDKDTYTSGIIGRIKEALSAKYLIHWVCTWWIRATVIDGSAGLHFPATMLHASWECRGCSFLVAGVLVCCVGQESLTQPSIMQLGQACWQRGSCWVCRRPAAAASSWWLTPSNVAWVNFPFRNSPLITDWAQSWGQALLPKTTTGSTFWISPSRFSSPRVEGKPLLSMDGHWDH